MSDTVKEPTIDKRLVLHNRDGFLSIQWREQVLIIEQSDQQTVEIALDPCAAELLDWFIGETIADKSLRVALRKSRIVHRDTERLYRDRYQADASTLTPLDYFVDFFTDRDDDVPAGTER